MGSLGQTCKMKTILIFQASLLLINGAKLEKKCDREAEEIFRQDCKPQCEVEEPRYDCAMCIWKHQDYDAASCKGETRGAQCWKTLKDIEFVDCKETKVNSDEPCVKDEECVSTCSIRADVKKLGLSCWAYMVMTGALHDAYA